MFLNRKKYLENLGKISTSEVSIDLGGKRVKFLISAEMDGRFDIFKKEVEKQFANVSDKNQDFSVEQNLIVVLYEIFSKNAGEFNIESEAMTPNGEDFFTKQEAVEAFKIILKSILND